MRGRYTPPRLVDRIVNHIEIVEVEIPLPPFPMYNIAPTADVPVVPVVPVVRDTGDGPGQKATRSPAVALKV